MNPEAEGSRLEVACPNRERAHGSRPGCIVFVASPSHGGSTLLDMLLSVHPKVCGVGEVARLIDPRERQKLIGDGRRRLCSCGESVTPHADCPLWRPLLERLEDRPGGGVAAGYAAILDEVARVAPGTRVLCDSSKEPVHLRRLAKAVQDPLLAGVELKVIQLVRDVRSFAASRRARQRDSLLGTWRQFGHWYRSNTRISAAIERSGLVSIRIGYEELCLYPHIVLPAIYEFLDLEFEPGLTDLGRSSGHVGVGNPMRMDAVRSKRIQYDHRWFNDDRIGLIHALRPRIRRFNRKMVYARVPRPPREARPE